MNEIYFSIIVPIFNMEKYISDAIESILQQSFKSFELILVNDGSTDNSKEICEQYKKKDGRIKLITTENQGAGLARNTGIENASGKYLFFVDPDDVVLDDALEKMYEETIKKEADLYVFGYEQQTRENKNKKHFKKVDEFYTGEELRKNYDMTFLDKNKKIEGFPWNNLFLNEKVKKYNIRYPNLKRKEDIIFMYRYINIISSIKFCNIIIYRYFTNFMNEYNKMSKEYLEQDTIKFKELYKTTLEWSNENYISMINIMIYYLNGVWKYIKKYIIQNTDINNKEKEKKIREILNTKEIQDSMNYLKDNNKHLKKYFECCNYSKKRKIKFLIRLRLMKRQAIRPILFYSKIK